MKAISIKQPWASLIVEGLKDIENRTWKCPEKYIGQRVLIHSSARPVSGFYNMALNTAQNTCVIASNNLEVFKGKNGAIIGSVEIVDCVINHPSIWAEKSIIEQMECPKCGCVESKYLGDGEHKCDRCKHTWWENENKPIYNWVLANPIKFPEPIPAKGKLSFWEFPNILAEPEEKDGELFCHCSLPVKLINQVSGNAEFGHYCRYCGGKWYK